VQILRAVGTFPIRVRGFHSEGGGRQPSSMWWPEYCFSSRRVERHRRESIDDVVRWQLPWAGLCCVSSQLRWGMRNFSLSRPATTPAESDQNLRSGVRSPPSGRYRVHPQRRPGQGLAARAVSVRAGIVTGGRSDSSPRPLSRPFRDTRNTLSNEVRTALSPSVVLLLLLAWAAVWLRMAGSGSFRP